jgi:Flp pilus assembly protein TadD
MRSFSSALAVLLLLATNAGAQQPPASSPATPPVAAPTSSASDEFAKAVFFGKKFFEMKDYTTAYQQFAKADSLQPDQPGVLYDMAMLLARAGRFSEAQSKVDRYNQLFPSGAEKPLAAKLQLELEFQRELQKKRQADGEYAELFTRGRFFYAKNDLAAALKQFQDAEQRRPNDPAAVFNQGVVYEKMGDFAKAEDRYHRYEDFINDPDEKAGVDQRLLILDGEIEDMKSKIVCPFCGLRLPLGATWCPRCWHGTYITSSALANTRPCIDGASATRATYYSDDRFAKNDNLPCLWNGTMLDALRYSPVRQKAIQETRKAEGWTYNGEVIQGWSDKGGNQIRYVQGADYLERVASPSGGDLLQFAAHAAGAGWLLDREDVIIDGQKYTSHYTFDAQSRISRQQVDYKNDAACGHVISMIADYAYANDVLTSVTIKGGYDGYVVEGSPKVEWQAAIAYSYDAQSRVSKEDLAVTSLVKTYTNKPVGAAREEVSRIYPLMRVRRPIENASRTGDLCATSGTLLVGNAIDLRPFYALSSDLAVQLSFGVTRASVTLTYPDSFGVK